MRVGYDEALSHRLFAGGDVTLGVANPGPDPVRFRLPDGREAALAGFASDWFDVRREPAPTAGFTVRTAS